MIRDERDEAREQGKTEGKAESILEILSDYGPVPEHLREQIMAEGDLDILKRWVKAAAGADSIDQFVKEMETVKR